MSYYITQLEGCFVLRKTDEDSDIANPQSKKISENKVEIKYKREEAILIEYNKLEEELKRIMEEK